MADVCPSCGEPTSPYFSKAQCAHLFAGIALSYATAYIDGRFDVVTAKAVAEQALLDHVIDSDQPEIRKLISFTRLLLHFLLLATDETGRLRDMSCDAMAQLIAILRRRCRDVREAGLLS